MRDHRYRTRHNRRRSRKARLGVEPLERRLLLYHGPTILPDGSLEVHLDKTLDQFGFQIAMFQAYDADPSNGFDDALVGFSIFDTGASVVTFSASDQSLFRMFGATGIPIKVPCGAEAEGIGGTLVGHVSQPGTVMADGLHISRLTFDKWGFPVFDLDFQPDKAAVVPDIQALVGAYPTTIDRENGCSPVASEVLPTITGTPMLNPTADHPDGLAAVIHPQGELLDFSDFPELNGLVIPVPDIFFQEPGQPVPDDDACTQQNPDGTTRDICTEPVSMDIEFVGIDNHLNPGNKVTESYNAVQRHVEIVHQGTTLSDQVFLFDTGAQLSVISTDQAAALGLDLNNPQDLLSVYGAAGTIEDIPGFVIDRLTLPLANGRTLTFRDVWVYVIDVAPGLLDGVLGMNLFNNNSTILYDPFDPAGPTVKMSFFTEHPSLASGITGDQLDMLRSLGLEAFAGTISGGHLPRFDLPDPPAGTTVELDRSGRLIISDAMGKADSLTIRYDPDTAELVISDPGSTMGTTVGRLAGEHEVRVPLDAITGGAIQVNLGAGDDWLRIDYSGGPLGLPLGYDGGAGSDGLEFVGDPPETPFGAVEYTVNGPDSGAIDHDGRQQVEFTGLEPILDRATASDRTFTIESAAYAGDHQVQLGNDASRAGFSQIVSTGGLTFEQISFANPSRSLTVATGRGDDVVRVAALDAAFAAALTINGQGGNDLLDASAATVPVTLLGGGGADTLQGSRRRDSLDGGAGRDTADFSQARRRVVVRLDRRFAAGQGRDRLAAIDNLIGSEFNDLLVGNSRANRIKGGRGNDVIRGGAGNDKLDGQQGNDRLDGGPGNDRIDGGTGDDTARGGRGNDRVRGGDDADVLVGSAGNDVMRGGNGDDRLTGRSGQDRLFGDDGDDSLDGGGKNDTLRGGAGNDTLNGGGGHDLVVGNGGDDSLAGGPGRDRGRDKLYGGPGNDTLTGNPGIDELFGNAGFDLLLADLLDRKLVVGPGGGRIRYL